MCGRYKLAVSEDELIDHVRAEYDIEDLIPELSLPRYNIAPGQKVLAIVNDGTKNRLGYLTWGFPIGKPDEPHALINAKAETIEEKPSFASALKNHRCVILANGFYEWKRTDHGKIPMHVSLKTGEIFAFAGIWAPYWNAQGQKEYGCAIITTTPNEVMEPIHHRMPVILPKEKRTSWLMKTSATPIHSKDYLKPFDASSMIAFEVSNYVNAAANDDEGCVIPRT